MTPREVGSPMFSPAQSKLSRFCIYALLLPACISAFSPAQAVRAPGVLTRAQAALDQNHPEEAIGLLAKHLQAHSEDDGARLLLAEAYVMEGHAQPAEKQYDAILKHSPTNYIALSGLGELYASTGRIQQAEPLLARAVKHSQGEPQLRIEWSQALARLHRFLEASQALRGVTASTVPDERLAYFRLRAAVAEGLGNSAEAATNMESALLVRPDDPSLQITTAAAQLHAGNAERAAVLGRAAFSQTQNPDAGLLVLQAEFAAHADEHATMASLRRLPLPPEQESSFRQHLAEILVAHGEFGEAAADLTRAAELDAENPDVLFNLTLAQFRAGAAAEALASAERCKAVKDSAELESLLGDIEETLGDNLAAVKSYQSAAAIDPKNENYQLAVAVELIRHRNFQPAKLVLENAAKTFPASWRIQVGLGMIEYFTGTRTKASEILLHAADLAPQPEPALRYLADIELDETAPPDPPAIARVCAYADAHLKDAQQQLYCGALMFRRAYAEHDNARVRDIIRRLSSSAEALPKDATPRCELVKAYVWTQDWDLARENAEICARVNPNSAQAHYRLARIYQHIGETERAQKEMELYARASDRLTEENEQHENNLNTFVLTIQKAATEDK